jgi:hypothetical protein
MENVRTRMLRVRDQYSDQLPADIIPIGQVTGSYLVAFACAKNHSFLNMLPSFVNQRRRLRNSGKGEISSQLLLLGRFLKYRFWPLAERHRSVSPAL